MWRNTSFARFVEALRAHNSLERNPKVSVCGLDLYSLSRSLKAVSDFFKRHDREAAERIKSAEECLHPWHFDPSHYGLAVWRDQIASCEPEVLALLRALHETDGVHSRPWSRERFSALQNARVVKNAERYYRMMYRNSVDSWNLRDRHMFDTLVELLKFHGSEARAIVWAHNSHIGDARATQMGHVGELNIGQLCRQAYGDGAYAIGFLTNRGTVAAASHWEGETEIKELRRVREDSHEHVLASTGVPAFFLPMAELSAELANELAVSRLERAVGVLYLPSSERVSHYFRANLNRQFDEVCWVDETRAVVPLEPAYTFEESDTYPFGL